MSGALAAAAAVTGGTALATAAAAASAAALPLQGTNPTVRARLLEAIAQALEEDREALLAAAAAETALAAPRLAGEFGRMLFQWCTAARLVREGSWVQAIIDRADPRRTPLPRPDVRRCLVPVGPVAVFGASNFPFAFGTAGGDTVAAIAAGCPVIVKAHPAHPRTAAITGDAVARGVRAMDLPGGVFQQLADGAVALGHALVAHPAIQAAAFTGSAQAGQALIATAQARPQPIPVYAEMGSLNPVLLLPQALRARGEAIARALAAAVTGSMGQLCTKPGLIVGTGPAWPGVAAAIASAVAAAAPAPLLHAGVLARFEQRCAAIAALVGPPIAQAPASVAAAGTTARPCVFTATVAEVEALAELREEVFGPATVLVTAQHATEITRLVACLPGQLTATIHAEDADADIYAGVMVALEARCGRIIHDGVPTGVEVVPAMHHGGPFPASSDARATAVGTGALQRFVRPLCLQDRPDRWLPPCLQDANPWGILRQVDGVWSRDPVIRPAG